VYLPGASNVLEQLFPDAMSPELHAPFSLVTVWGTASLLVQVTVCPAPIRSGALDSTRLNSGWMDKNEKASGPGGPGRPRSLPRCA